jgi:hypothetical protein
MADSKKKDMKDVPGQIDVLQETTAQNLAPNGAAPAASDGGANEDSSKGKKKGSPHNAYVLNELNDINGILGLLFLLLPEENFNYLVENYTDFKEVQRFHVNDDLGSSEYDTVYEGVHKTILGKTIIIAIEVKSSPDKFASFQLARYVIEYHTKSIRKIAVCRFSVPLQ